MRRCLSKHVPASALLHRLKLTHDQMVDVLLQQVLFVPENQAENSSQQKGTKGRAFICCLFSNLKIFTTFIY